jgi:GH24 family phage-related lysozyme (muramidase)
MVTDQAIEFIKRWECNGVPVLTSYWDHKQHSIGFGTRAEGPNITITEEEAEQRLKESVRGFDAGLSNRLTTSLTDTQYIGLLSAAFNLGVGALDHEIIGLVNKGRFRDAADALRGYDHASGVQLPALTARRFAESQLLEGDMRGRPRIDYERTYWLMPPDATVEEWIATATRSFETHGTIGFSADDAGIGDLRVRKVVLMYPARQPPGICSWFETHYPGVEVIYEDAMKPIPIVNVESKAKVGLHGSADGSWGNAILGATQSMVRKGRIEAYKGLSTEHPDTADVLREINPDIFIMIRMMAKVNTDRPLVSDFLADTLQSCERWAEKGITFIEVHNEPNLTDEGLGVWKDGSEFADWFNQVASALRDRIPGVKVGWPGLSPGGDIPDRRAAALPFFEQAQSAVENADWIGAHCYFRNYAERVSLSGGQYYRHYMKGDKPILITEFSNPGEHTVKDAKALSYINYWTELDPVVHSAYSFISTASSGFPHEVWSGSSIADIVGGR